MPLPGVCVGHFGVSVTTHTHTHTHGPQPAPSSGCVYQMRWLGSPPPSTQISQSNQTILAAVHQMIDSSHCLGNESVARHSTTSSQVACFTRGEGASHLFQPALSASLNLYLKVSYLMQPPPRSLISTNQHHNTTLAWSLPTHHNGCDYYYSEKRLSGSPTVAREDW